MNSLKTRLLVVAIALVGIGASHAAGVTPFATKDPTRISDADAYSWAYANGITTQTTMAKANMTGVIRRYELAKMLSQFYVNVQKHPILHNVKCDVMSYSDSSTFTTEMKTYIQNVCDLGLMGWNGAMTGLLRAFNPTGLLSAIDTNIIIIRYIKLAHISYSYKLPSVINRGNVFRLLRDMSGFTGSSSSTSTTSAGGAGGVGTSSAGGAGTTTTTGMTGSSAGGAGGTTSAGGVGAGSSSSAGTNTTTRVTP